MKKGISLIEALIAISLLTFSVVGPMSLISKSLAATSYAKDEIMAFYLAHEALDVIRNIRDTNLKISAPSWTSITTRTGEVQDLKVVCENGCTFDVWENPPLLQTTFISGDQYIKQRTCADGTKLYGYNFGQGSCPRIGPIDPDTIFKREIYVKDVSSGSFDNEISVTAVVKWKANNGVARDVVLNENLFKLSF